MKLSLSLIVLLAAGCSESKEPAKSEPAAAAKAPAPALAPKDRIDAVYAEIFQQGPMLPMPERIEKFVAKVGAPKRVENGSRLWFARDADGACHEMTLEESGTISGTKISDEARAVAECGAAPTK